MLAQRGRGLGDAGEDEVRFACADELEVREVGDSAGLGGRWRRGLADFVDVSEAIVVFGAEGKFRPFLSRWDLRRATDNKTLADGVVGSLLEVATLGDGDLVGLEREGDGGILGARGGTRS